MLVSRASSGFGAGDRGMATMGTGEAARRTGSQRLASPPACSLGQLALKASQVGDTSTLRASGDSSVLEIVS